MEKSDSVSLTVHGNVRITEFPEESNVCVKLNTVAVGDWKIITGDTVALSSFSYRGADNRIFIDLPFECGLKGSSPFMWPRLVLNCFSKDTSGKDCVIGYGVLPIPTEPGKHICRVHCFLPEPSSIVQQMMAKLRRMNAEFVDPLLPANADGRYACRTSTRGYVDIEINVSIKSSETGYRFAPSASSEAKINNSHQNVPSSIADLAGIVAVGGEEHADIFGADSENEESKTTRTG
ncbi:Protein CBR-MKSR-1 [Caenorhabditis briggsae]|uniref:B9 domain-containing protein 1 n=1 Tax=Caenorhabditis briggsae TaxID=6238 RepID=A8XCB9_CAEBR|nr:Protein CBR-MKSR-1 [Caenorhabditis briggsae]CAP30286.1 Protein CBR-MKSR-1 [Caenorhabditis briggsae]